MTTHRAPQEARRAGDAQDVLLRLGARARLSEVPAVDPAAAREGVARGEPDGGDQGRERERARAEAAAPQLADLEPRDAHEVAQPEHVDPIEQPVELAAR